MKDPTGEILTAFVTALQGNVTYNGITWHVYKEQPLSGKMNNIYLSEVFGSDESAKDNDEIRTQLKMLINVAENNRSIANELLDTAIPLIESITLNSTNFQFTLAPIITSNRTYRQNNTWTKEVVFNFIVQQVSLPTLTTVEASDITATTATSGGTITSSGNSVITAKGVCWSTSENPTIEDSKTSDGIGKGSFTSSLTGLTEDETYYVRSYATNSVGTSYGTQVSFVAETPYCAEYQTIYNSLTTKPSDAIALEQNTFVETLVNAGVWSKLDVFYNFAQTINSDGEALKNWVNPGTFDATTVNSPTFTALEGFAGDGSTSYLNSNYIPSSNAINLSTNSASIGIYSRTDIENISVDMGSTNASNANALMMAIRYPSIGIIIRNNTATISSVSNPTSLGLHINNRVSSTEQEAYKNKTRILLKTVSSTGLSSYKIYIGSNNQANSTSFFSTKQISMAFIAGGLSQTDIDTLTDAFEVYMDSNSKGVIA